VDGERLTVHSPKRPVNPEKKLNMLASAPTSLVFHAEKAESIDAMVRGTRSGCVLAFVVVVVNGGPLESGI